MKLRLHIERLVLEGVDVGLAERPRLMAAVESELGRLLAEGGLSPELSRGGAFPSLPAPQVHLAPDAAPSALGAAIAGSVHHGLRGRR